MRYKVIRPVIVLLAAALTLFIACGVQSGLVEVADKFFAAVKQGDYETAYQYVSSDFKKATSIEQLKTFLESSSLANYESASWPSWSVTTEQGELEGTIRTADGESIPVTLTFIKTDDGWKIHYIHRSAAGISEEPTGGREVPGDDRARELATESVMMLARSINAEDFGGFYSHVSQLWQLQTTPGDLQGFFQDFIDQEVDLTVIKGMEPVFSEAPYIDDDNLLQLKGYYPTDPMTTHFELSYMYEHPNWKLVRIDVETRQS
jgi:hypothetical protein